MENQLGTKWETLHIKPQQCMLTISSKKLLILLTHEKKIFDITDKIPLPSLGVNQWSLLFQHLILSFSGRGAPLWTISTIVSQCSSVSLVSLLLGWRDHLVLESV